ncbi:uncharacterized protein UV8b_02328 [Ustilaginoidea virens]|uniref:Uncharacterized protein n=1 Tax=Ustilaginoidea virens TaxID=1159556 RepID=A0A8E5HMK8_USTVR|nr:uncharacterized protein UV8b_02328 [Ustilaginoidea virens]QUC18087.1 hypothetical protein UV8b_02328 [Ustilaginoidea virens]
MVFSQSFPSTQPAPAMPSSSDLDCLYPPTTPTAEAVGGSGIIFTGPMIPGTRCPTCALEGKEVWVIPGRCCGYCGTPCDDEH